MLVQEEAIAGLRIHNARLAAEKLNLSTKLAAEEAARADDAHARRATEQVGGLCSSFMA